MPPVGFEPTISAGERPAAARLLGSWVRIPPGAWIFVCCECRVLSGRGLCDELITRPEESYRLCCIVVCDLGAPYIYDISHLRVNSGSVLGRSFSNSICCHSLNSPTADMITSTKSPPPRESTATVYLQEQGL